MSSWGPVPQHLRVGGAARHPGRDTQGERGGVGRSSNASATASGSSGAATVAILGSGGVTVTPTVATALPAKRHRLPSPPKTGTLSRRRAGTDSRERTTLAGAGAGAGVSARDAGLTGAAGTALSSGALSDRSVVLSRERIVTGKSESTASGAARATARKRGPHVHSRSKHATGTITSARTEGRYVGISRSTRTDLWRAEAHIAGTPVSLGTRFASPEAAARVVDQGTQFNRLVLGRRQAEPLNFPAELPAPLNVTEHARVRRVLRATPPAVALAAASAGVSFNPDIGRWLARPAVGGLVVDLGVHDTADAAALRCTQAIEHTLLTGACSTATVPW